VGVALLAMAPGCHEELDTSRTLPPRGSVGEEMFGVICDRVGAQALREDLSGDSFRNVCHKLNGVYADKVDVALLPPINAGVEAERLVREKMVGRVEALARRRAEVIRALDATFPAGELVPAKLLDHPDAKKTCNERVEKAPLSDQVADMLGRMTDLYHDGTLPGSTQALGRLVDSFDKSPEAQEAWSRLSVRQGYRPIDTALGAIRPIVAYPRLRDLSNATLRLLSADSNPYSLDSKYLLGQRLPIPGPGHDAFKRMLDAAKEELLDTKVDPTPDPITTTLDPVTGRIELSRPRSNLEMMQETLFAPDDKIDLPAKYIVRRDARGFALTPSSAQTIAPKAGLPSPFPFSGTDDTATRDEFGRAMVDGKLAYEYLDTSHTSAARLFEELRPMTDKTVMDLAAGTYTVVGPRDKIHESPVLDLIHALGSILGDKNADSTLAMSKTLIETKEPELARAVTELMHSLDIAKAHPEAKIGADVPFWDDAIEFTAAIAEEPHMLEELLEALADPAVGKNLGPMLSSYGKFRDEISYDIHDLNGAPFNKTTNNKDVPHTPVDRGQPATGLNRSMLTRFMRLISDTSGVTLCSKEGAKLEGVAEVAGRPIHVTLPLTGGGYKECEVFKVPDLSTFYLQSIVNTQNLPGKGTGESCAADWECKSLTCGGGTCADAGVIQPGVIYIRDKLVRDGFPLPFIDAKSRATVKLMEDSSGIHGFWTQPDSRILAPTPKWMNRLAFFDWKNDNVNEQTRKHIDSLNGQFLGSSTCAERAVEDPLPNEIDAAPIDPKDGKRWIHGLRQCKDGDWFQQRNPNTIFMWEHFGFYETMKAILTPFVRHKKERLFTDLTSKIYKQYLDASASADECHIGPGENCSRKGLVAYEALVSEVLATDLVPALSNVMRALQTVKIKQCDETRANGACAKSRELTGIEIAAQATRAIIDPDQNKGLTDRYGNVSTKGNDGREIKQITPAYLLTNALDAIDRAYGGDEARHDEFRRGRSKMADQFARVENGRFGNPIVSKLTPKIIDVLRSQLHARCPRPDKERCAWARDELAQKAETTLGGPLVSNGLEVLEVIRKDPDSRTESEYLLAYLLDRGATNDALANTLASFSDMIQLLGDEENLVPLYHVLASAIDGLDPQLAMLARISGKYIDKDGTEICSREIDPNQVLAVALRHLVSPIKDSDFKGQSPLEVIIDVVADVNRIDPTKPYDGTLAKEDYSSVSVNVVDFLTNKERGLEQFYEVIRQGTRF
jgi:hypothetical protein